MGTHELEHLRLSCHKLLEALILLLKIGMEVVGKCAHDDQDTSAKHQERWCQGARRSSGRSYHNKMG